MLPVLAIVGILVLQNFDMMVLGAIPPFSRITSSFCPTTPDDSSLGSISSAIVGRDGELYHAVDAEGIENRAGQKQDQPDGCYSGGYICHAATANLPSVLDFSLPCDDTWNPG
jgi:hypothetical protein